MDIKNYQTLISALPVRQQSFTTKRSTWEKAERVIDWLPELNNKIFGKQEALCISRQEILDSNSSIKECILKTIYWGYTAGMRGNHFVNILHHIQTLEEVFKGLNNSTNLSASDFNELAKGLKNITGLGLSTYSKLLYFFNVKFDNNTCLILDQRLIDVFANKSYSQFASLGGINYNNAETKYLEYLSIMEKAASELETKGENVEQFLFIFGNSLNTKTKP